MIPIFHLPLIGRLIKKIESEAKTFGWQHAFHNLITRSHSTVSICSMGKETKKVLLHKACVIVANHPYEAETIALIASLPRRKDLYLIVNAMFMGISPTIDKHLIPVYIRHHFAHKNKKPFLGWFMDTFYPKEKDTPEEEHKKNIQSIQLASRRVKEGGLVIIYPGRRSSDSKWFDGVGYLLKGAGKTKIAYVVKVYTTGTSNWDYLRLLPYVGRFLPAVNIYFSQPNAFRKYTSGDGKEITRILEEEYNSWVKSIEKKYMTI